VLILKIRTVVMLRNQKESKQILANLSINNRRFLWGTQELNGAKMVSAESWLGFILATDQMTEDKQLMYWKERAVLILLLLKNL